MMQAAVLQQHEDEDVSGAGDLPDDPRHRAQGDECALLQPAS